MLGRVIIDPTSEQIIRDYPTNSLIYCYAAGSERAGTSSNGRQGQLAEARHINTSLSVLGRVIIALTRATRSAARGEAAPHVPYRDSRLTFLLEVICLLQNQPHRSQYENQRMRSAACREAAPHVPYRGSRLTFLLEVNACSQKMARNTGGIEHAECLGP